MALVNKNRAQVQQLYAQAKELAKFESEQYQGTASQSPASTVPPQQVPQRFENVAPTQSVSQGFNNMVQVNPQPSQEHASISSPLWRSPGSQPHVKAFIAPSLWTGAAKNALPSIWLSTAYLQPGNPTPSSWAQAGDTKTTTSSMVVSKSGKNSGPPSNC